MTRSRPTARQVLRSLLDEGSYLSWDVSIDVTGCTDRYREELRAAAQRADVDESVLTGQGTVGGRQIAVVVSEFRFMGGSIGVAAAERLERGIREATRRGLPLIASTASGGTRMQEGTAAFVRMVGHAKALDAHRAAGLPYIVHLRHPTTGGVFASWGSMGHLTAAEPGALIGFLGPRVVEGLSGTPLPPGVQTAENLVAKGVLDAVVDHEQLRDFVDRVLRVTTDAPGNPRLDRRVPSKRRATEDRQPARATDAWTSVMISRRSGRAGVREILRYAAADTVQIAGTNDGQRDDSVVTALTRIDGMPCVLIGQDRAAQVTEGMLPAGLRQAKRAMGIADELGLPVVTLIDTPGAALSRAAEESGLGREIAACMRTLLRLGVPTLSVLLGQGAGGGALALFPANARIAATHSWLAPLPPEGASLLMHGTPRFAEEMANSQHIGCMDLLERGLIDAVVPERGGDTAEAMAMAIGAEIGHQLRGVRSSSWCQPLRTTLASC